jgi:hypothetical protein
MSLEQLALVADAALVQPALWEQFVARFTALELARGFKPAALEPVVCKQSGTRFTVVAKVNGKERVATHRTSIDECAEAIAAGRKR